MGSLGLSAYSESHVPNHPQCSPQKIRIIFVGAGAAGLLFAHKAEKFLTNYELICYEKNSVVGGTWYENNYPGCACDIPAHTYTFPFEPNTEWSGYYSYANEIQRYFLNFAKKYKVEKYIRFNTTVQKAQWRETDSKWVLELEDKDQIRFEDTCDVLVNGSGAVNKWKWPGIRGLEKFQGQLVHSAAWDSSIDWEAKRVGLIGSGSSSIQILPQVASTAKHVDVFIRNQTYIGPQIGSDVSNKDADPDAMEPHAVGKHHYTEKEKKKFREDPDYHLTYRKKLERSVVTGFQMFYRNSDLNIKAKEVMQASMAERLDGREDLKQALIPDWSPGCRRLTPGEGYLEALTRPNVSAVFGDIHEITATGLNTVDGQEHTVDILICATGFNVAYIPHFTITGTNGQVMQEQTRPNIYASIAAPGYPNYFIVNGPRGNWGQGCALPSHEVQVEYILKCCRKMQQDHIRYIEPRCEITRQLNLYMDAWHEKHSIWTENCRSWYKDNQIKGRVYIWPGSLLHHLKYLKRPRFEHYHIVYNDPSNVFAFLGNGWTIAETQFGKDVPIPYIRNHEDEEWDIE
ncbi:hypothetical protein H2200_010334 [Cladophialophora chaetospira]|uniref:Sterigmatocystin biosynthesis monooxygenase stcW n=1 Tax=Cladophialophora chaetospira TaxID=386627 RepID=A0AA38X1C9_9EURO|nr:hypothetical protein H2200_010334 [Cladophialophora chaetospira]